MRFPRRGEAPDDAGDVRLGLRVECYPRGRQRPRLRLRYRRRGEAAGNAGEVVADLVRTERELLRLLSLGGTREHEIAPMAGLHPGDDVDIPPVPDHRR